MEMDAIDLNSGRVDDDDLVTTGNVNGWGSPKDVKDYDAQRDPSLAENHPSVLMSDDISKSLLDLTSNSPSPSAGAAAEPSPSKLDKATALARAALRNRFAELEMLNSSETTPLLISNIWDSRKTDSSASNLDASGSYSVSTINSSNSNEKEVKESKLPLNSLDTNNITRPFKCPGCEMDSKSFSGTLTSIGTGKA